MRGHSSLRGAPNRRHDSGFTLVELVLSMVLLGILGAVGSTMISDSYNTTRLANAEAATEGQARYALERLAREIREIKFSSTTSAYCINTMTATNLVFYKTNVPPLDPACATNVITVSILGSGSNLTLQYSSPAATSNLSNNVGSGGFTLKYCKINEEVTCTADATNIAFVNITLTVTDSTSGQSTKQRTRVALRNG